MLTVFAAIGSWAAARIAVPSRVPFMKKWNSSMTARPMAIAMRASGGTMKAPIRTRLTEKIGGNWKTLLPQTSMARFCKMIDSAIVASTMKIVFALAFMSRRMMHFSISSPTMYMRNIVKTSDTANGSFMYR